MHLRAIDVHVQGSERFVRLFFPFLESLAPSSGRSSVTELLRISLNIMVATSRRKLAKTQSYSEFQRFDGLLLRCLVADKQNNMSDDATMLESIQFLRLP